MINVTEETGKVDIKMLNLTMISEESESYVISAVKDLENFYDKSPLQS